MRRAVELNPNDHHAWHQLGNYYRAMGRPTDAIRARERAVALDPLNVRIGVVLAGDYLHAHRFDEALAQYRKVMRIDPAHPLMLGLGPQSPLGPWLVYYLQGRYTQVVDEYVRIASMRGASAGELAELRAPFQSGGMSAFWRKWIDFDLRHTGGKPDTGRMASYHALAGDTAQALDWSAFRNS